MQNKLEIFKNEEFGEVRTTILNDKPYVCLTDVCKILEIKNARDCKSRLNQKGVVTTDTLTAGGVQKMTFIDESNLYKIIFQSRKPEAEKFTDWVTSEVLPAIRKTGGYVSNDEMFINTYLPFADATTKQLFASTLKTVREQNMLITEMKPKVDYFDALVDRNLLTNLRDTAKEIGVAPGKFNEYLLKNGFAYRDSKKKIKPYQTKVAQGLFELKEFVNPHSGHADNQIMVTPKGRETFRLLVEEVM